MVTERHHVTFIESLAHSLVQYDCLQIHGRKKKLNFDWYVYNIILFNDLFVGLSVVTFSFNMFLQKSDKKTWLGKLKSSFLLNTHQSSSYKYTDSTKEQRRNRNAVHTRVVLSSNVDESAHFTNQTDTQHSSNNTVQAVPSFQSSNGAKPFIDYKEYVQERSHPPGNRLK